MMSFGNLLKMDVDSKNNSQFIDAMLLIECNSSNDIPYTLNVHT